MLLVGLSGGIGSGKSSVGRALAARGATVIDADQVAREILAPGSPGERAVLERFGPAVARPDGALDRQALAAVVFADDRERGDLEAITHPLVHLEVMGRTAAAEASVVVVEVPLLDAARRREYAFDKVVLVATPPEDAVQRAVARGMGEDDVRARMADQPNDDQRRAVADRVLDNSGTPVDLEAEVDRLWRWLTARAGPAGPGS